MTGGPREAGLSDLAERVGGEIRGDAGLIIRGIAPLETAGPADLSFLSNLSYVPAAKRTRAGAVIVGPGVDLGDRTVLVVRDPYLALAVLLDHFHPPDPVRPGISDHARLGLETVVEEGASIGPGVVIGDRSHVGAGTRIRPGVVIGSHVRIGREAHLHPNVVIEDRCVLGDRVVVHAGTVIGSDGFGFALQGARRRRIPQVGNVVIGDDVEIGANVTIDRATFGSTTIGRGTKIDNLVQIGHNVTIGEDCVLVAQVGISGSSRLGDRVILAGQSGLVGHITIGDGVVVGAKSAVTGDVPAGAFVIGHPAIDAPRWKRAAAVFAKLPDLRRRVMRLEGRAPSGRDENEEET